MPTTRIDMEISRSKEAYQLREEYEKEFLSGSDPDKTNVNRGPFSGTKRG